MWPADMGENGGAISLSGTNSVVLEDIHSHTSPVQPPNLQSIKINKSSRIHIGPHIVTVTQNLQKTQVVRVRFLCVSLGSSRKLNKAAAFACCNFLALCALAIYFICVAVTERLPQLDIGLRTSWYLRRADWQAADPLSPIEFLNLPVSHIVISHTEKYYCDYRYFCIAYMLGLQQDHMLLGHGDIAPNFLVSANGLVFEGRGANVMGSMVRYWNSRSIVIAFMGDYMVDQAAEVQFDHVNVLLEVLIQNGVLRQNYTLHAHCQLQRNIVHPGSNVIRKLERFPHWDDDNSTRCLIK